MSIRIAAAQYPIDRVTDFAAYAAKLRKWVAAAAGAQLLLFPEYAGLELSSVCPGDACTSLPRQLAAVQAQLENFLELHRALARESGAYILAGSIPVAVAGQYRNRAYFFSPSGAMDFQEKLMMTRFENEDWCVCRGDTLKVFMTALGPIGVNVCYDVEFPLFAQRQVEAGARLLLVPCCTDTLAGYHRVSIGARARALENQVFVASAATVGDAPWNPALDINIGAAGIFGPVDRGFPDDGIIRAGALNEPVWVMGDCELQRLDVVRDNGQVRNFRDWELSARVAAAPIKITKL